MCTFWLENKLIFHTSCIFYLCDVYHHYKQEIDMQKHSKNGWILVMEVNIRFGKIWFFGSRTYKEPCIAFTQGSSFLDLLLLSRPTQNFSIAHNQSVDLVKSELSSFIVPLNFSNVISIKTSCILNLFQLHQEEFILRSLFFEKLTTLRVCYLKWEKYLWIMLNN